jgi:hypothetical protein
LSSDLTSQKVRRMLQKVQPTIKKIRRLLPWLPLLVPVVGVGLITWNMVFTGITTSLNATKGLSGKTPVRSGGLPFILAPTGPAGSISPLLNIEVGSFDLPSRMLSIHLNLELQGETVRQLRIAASTRSTPVPLTSVPRRLWSQVPVEIYLGPCFLSLPQPRTCIGSPVTVPLGQLIGPGGTATNSGVSANVSLPVYGSSVRYPSDYYVVRTTPAVILESPVSLDTNGGKYSANKYYLPLAVLVSWGVSIGGLTNYTVTAVGEAATRPMVVGIVISRPLANELTVYVTAILPLMLAVVLALAWFARDQRPSFDFAFVAGLIAAMLAILPLRAVLVPADLGSDSLTFVDDILLLGVMFIAGFTFWQYASLTTKAAQKGILPSGKQDTDEGGADNA